MYEFSKRALDIVGAAIGIVLVSPLIAIIAVLVKRDSRGPVFFRQERLGRNGEPFTMVKFRTMVADNDETAHREYMERHVKGESESRINDEGGEVFLLDDDRVTPFGSRLRRTSLDELPNLVNVLRGPMSLVGPRPPIPYEVEHYDERAMRRALRARWQFFPLVKTAGYSTPANMFRSCLVDCTATILRAQ